MLQYMRVNLLLLVLTLLICSILYPPVLWGIGQTFFGHQAQTQRKKGGHPAVECPL